MSQNFHIPKPCSENWSTMTAVEKGKLCELCNKKVHDLTTMNNVEIQNIFKSEEKVCGRIKKTYPNYNVNIKKYGIVLSLASVLGFTNLNAKTNSSLIPSEITITYQSHSIKKDTIILKGTVKESKMPLSGVLVKLKGTKLETNTDFDGHFSLIITNNEIPQELILIFSYIGMETKEVEIKKNYEKIEVELSSDNMLLGEVVIIKKSFWRRIFGS